MKVNVNMMWNTLETLKHMNGVVKVKSFELGRGHH